MKKFLFLMVALCVLLAGCNGAENADAQAAEADAASTDAGVALTGVKISPLPDTTMDNLSDAILSVSLEEGDAYVDDTGIMRMDLKIYSYDKYDMVDISMLKVGDVLVTNGGEVQVSSLERDANGTLAINGGLEAGGISLGTDESGIFYECEYNDAKNWYEVGEATIRVSVDFMYYDNSDMDAGEIAYYPGDFLVGAVPDYHFTPDNTTIRVENDQIIEMHREYMP